MGRFALIAVGVALATSPLQSQDFFIKNMHAQVMAAIESADTLPGFDLGELGAIKTIVAECWEELIEKGYLEVTAADHEVRPYFVALQAFFEHVVCCELNKSITSLKSVICTPMPTTALCKEGEVSPELLTPSLGFEEDSLFTFKPRTTTLRDYLFLGGDLYVVYPKEGLYKRTEAEQTIYKRELENYPLNLFDWPLECESIDLIGALYLFKNTEGKTFAFALAMTQANDRRELGHYGLWFGELTDPPVHNRVESVLHFIRKHSPKPFPL